MPNLYMCNIQMSSKYVLGIALIASSSESSRKAFSKFYHRHSELIVKYNIGLKTLLQQGISEPIFYGNLVYKFKRIVGKPNLSDQFKNILTLASFLSTDNICKQFGPRLGPINY